MAAPVVPVIPAPAAAPAPAAPAAPVSVSQMIQDLRGSITEEGGLPRPVDPDAPAAPVLPERNADGTFITPPVIEAAPVVEGAEEEGAVTTDAGPVAGEEGADDEWIEIELPSARDPSQTIKAMFPKADVQLIEQINFLKNNGIRREEFNRLKTPVLQLKEELDYVEDRIRLSPAAFVLETMSPETRLEVALSILAQDGMLEQAQPFLAKWTDPEKGELNRLTDRTAIDKEHGDQKDTVAAKITERRELRVFTTRLTETVDAVASVLPPNMAARAGMFADDILRDLETAAGISERNSKIIRGLSPADLMKIVAPRLEFYGLTLEQAQAALDPSKPRLPTARPEGETARAVAAAAAARKTGKVFRQGADARRAAASVPSPTAGAAPPASQPPKGQTIQQRSDWLRSRLNIPTRHGKASS